MQHEERLRRGRLPRASADLLFYAGMAEAEFEHIEALVRDGALPQAEAALAAILSRDPRAPEALRLRGFVRAQQGRMGEAEALFRQSLAARADHALTLTQLGRLLAATGRREQAIEVLTRAAGATPSLTEPCLLLGQVHAAMGDLTAAETHYREALARDSSHPAAISGLGAVLNDLGRAAEAEAVLRTAAGDAVWAPRIAHNLGVALELQRRHGEALEQWDRALAGMPEVARTHHNRAKTLEHLGRNADAVDAYRATIARDPANAKAHEELNALLFRLGRDAELLQSYDEALRRAPREGGLLLQKGSFLLRCERFAEARECFARASAIAPGAPAVHAGLAAAYAGLGELEGAIAAYERALAIQADDANAINLASVVLEAGDAQRALSLTEGVVRRRPLDQGALAVHEIASRATDDPRAAWLTDYAHHVRVYDLDPPPGFASMAALNEALNAHLDTLHTDLREHFDQTLRRGTQTSEPLLASENALVRALRAQIEAALADYIAAMPEDAAHPLSSRRRNAFAFAGSWSSRLQDSGFHTNHIHAEGWISSCYYVDLPDVVADTHAQQGWIKFGEPSFRAALRDPVQRTVQPAPGRLVLFPSYMWHGTIPFRAARARTTIAFDAVPRP